MSEVGNGGAGVFGVTPKTPSVGEEALLKRHGAKLGLAKAELHLVKFRAERGAVPLEDLMVVLRRRTG